MENHSEPVPASPGAHLNSRQNWLSDSMELLSSMRFAISLLVLIATASVIGTVLKQNEPMPNYVNQFGPFWFEVFGKFSLYNVYSAWWFLVIMAFLVISTTLCLIRNAPKMLRDMRSWRENVREQSLRNFHHHAEWHSAARSDVMSQRLAGWLQKTGYRFRILQKDGGLLVTAKQGAGNKWGYIFAHSAIVIICIGGMLDSELPIRFQQWVMGKVPFDGNGIIAKIPEQHRLPLANPTFRGNTLIPEGASSNTAIISQSNGVLIQDLPFTIKLKKFTIDFYSTGMPKLFASDVEITDHETGQSFSSTIKVNQPLSYKGITMYQSSFEDGGSKLKLTAYPMTGDSEHSFEVDGEVGGSTPLKAGQAQPLNIEWSGFRPFNVENMSRNGNDKRAPESVRSLNEKITLGVEQHLGSAAKNANSKDLKNVGPSVQYKLRDQTGQAREFLNYMQPVVLDGDTVFLAGTRDSAGDGFRYLRIPADDNDTVTEWMRLRAAVQNPQLRELAAERYAKRALPPSVANAAQMQRQLTESAKKSLAIFAGDGKQAGYIAISKFLEQIPAADQMKAADVFMKILNGSLWDLWMQAREKDGLPDLPLDEKHGRFLQLATGAMSDAFFYGAPVFLQLKEFREVKASVLQVSRSPGKKMVYLGCLLLTLGVFAMFYIRERRLWIWLKDGEQGCTTLMALSTQRKTLDFEKEFEQIKAQIGAMAAEK